VTATVTAPVAAARRTGSTMSTVSPVYDTPTTTSAGLSSTALVSAPCVSA